MSAIPSYTSTPILVKGTQRKIVYISDKNTLSVGYIADESERQRLLNLPSPPNSNTIDTYIIPRENHPGEYIVYTSAFLPNQLQKDIGGYGEYDSRIINDTAVLGGISNRDLFNTLNMNTPSGKLLLREGVASMPQEVLPQYIRTSSFIANGTVASSPQPEPVAPAAPADGQSPSQPATQPAPQPTAAPARRFLSYPIIMLDDKKLPNGGIVKGQDRIRFRPLTMKKRGLPDQIPLAGAGFRYEFPVKLYDFAGDPVFIACQPPLTDQNSVEWGGGTINALESAGFMKSRELMNRANFAQELGNAVKTIERELRTNSEEILTYLAGQAVSVNNILARTDNLIINPNLELLFTSPQLRSFNFQFKMSAREEEEADEIIKIIRYFKRHMAPNKGELFVQAPNVFHIKYVYGSGSESSDTPRAHPCLNLFKVAALQNFSVDYTPLGSYATYQDGTPVAYNLNMQFQELTPIYSEDYFDYDGDNIIPGSDVSTLSIGY